MARKRRAYKSRIWYSTNAGVSYTQLVDCRMIEPPNEARGKSEITTLESPDEGDEFMPGMQKSGQVKVGVFYDAARYAALRALQRVLAADYDTDAPHRFKIEAPVAYGQTTRDTLIAFGFISEVKIKELKNEDPPMEIEITIEEANVSRTFTQGA